MGRKEDIFDFVVQNLGLDDDEIARALGIFPRQTVNQICRQLEKEGLLRRKVGRFDKIANFPPGSTVLITTRPDPVRNDRDELHPKHQLKPPLGSERLLTSGFKECAVWFLSPDGALGLRGAAPRERGVYAFIENGLAIYVGVATKNLSSRLNFYRRPGAGQITNIRLNRMISEKLRVGGVVSIYTATPPDQSWNGLPVNTCIGLELGLIEAYALPWNQRGV